jgi:hypothetical protein
VHHLLGEKHKKMKCLFKSSIQEIHQESLNQEFHKIFDILNNTDALKYKIQYLKIDLNTKQEETSQLFDLDLFQFQELNKQQNKHGHPIFGLFWLLMIM